MSDSESSLNTLVMVDCMLLTCALRVSSCSKICFMRGEEEQQVEDIEEGGGGVGVRCCDLRD